MRHVNARDACVSAERVNMKALIALIEALSARMDTLTVRLAELEMWIKQHE